MDEISVELVPVRKKKRGKRRKGGGGGVTGPLCKNNLNWNVAQTLTRIRTSNLLFGRGEK